MKLRIRHFFTFSFLFELFLFIFTQYLALGVAFSLAATNSAQTSSNPISPWQFILAFIIATVVLILILKYLKKPWLMQVLFYLAITEGLWIFGSAYFQWPDILFFLIGVFFLWFFYRNVIMHNIVIMMAISAMAVLFGLNLLPSSAIIILILLAIYDYIAVFQTKHMVSMFKGLAENKVYFSLIIPQTFKGIFKKISEVSPQTEFMFLGTGDLAIPAIFIIACLKISLLTSLWAGLGAVLGFIFLYILFVTQKEKAPMPGLPPIVLGCLIGYLISFLI
jgi:presenilin-like A22 family membrane protease